MRDECCNPAARSNKERCETCPMRNPSEDGGGTNPRAEPVNQGETAPSIQAASAPKRSLLWQALHDQLTRRQP